MKKSILALAVASAATLGSVAQADNTTLYGRVAMAVKNKSVSGSGGSVTGINNAGSRFGIRGTDELGNGLEAFYRFEFGIDPNRDKTSTTVTKKEMDKLAKLNANGQLKSHSLSANDGQTNRLGYVGLKGGFGAVALGRQWSPHYIDIMGAADVMNNVGYTDYSGIFRLGNVLSYTTPEMGGFKAVLALQADGKAEVGANRKHLDAYNIAAKYANNGISAGLSFIEDRNAKRKTLGGSFGYSNDMFNIAFAAEQQRQKGSSIKPRYFALAGEYNISEADTVRASVATKRKAFDNEKYRANEYAIGYQHNLSSRTRVWAEYSHHDVKRGTDTNTLSLGLRTDF